MATIEPGKPPGVSDSFFKKASEVLLNLATTDAELLKFLSDYSSGEHTSEGSLQAINFLMNMRNQRTELLTNLEEKRHNGSMSIISNLK